MAVKITKKGPCPRRLRRMIEWLSAGWAAHDVSCTQVVLGKVVERVREQDEE